MRIHPAIMLGFICAGIGSARAAMDPLEDIIARDAGQTVVIVNRNVPEGEALAREYMELRGIPTNRLCLLDLPVSETITRYFFENRLRDPLLEFLRAHELIKQVKTGHEDQPHASGWRTVSSNLRYLVSMYGVPLRIAREKPLVSAIMRVAFGDDVQNDGAAVDSELACILLEHHEIKGIVHNELYNQTYWTRNDWSGRPLVMAARLDGPDPDTVRRMMHDSLEAEKSGLPGRVYIDLRSIREPDYQLGDFWMREAAERMKRAGCEVVTDIKPELFPPDFPLEDVAYYLGWYSEHPEGPFASEGFRFRRGAVAYHLHSGSAKTLRSADQHWAGPLLRAGAAAVMGAVDEPYLGYTPDLQVFTDRLVSGHSFGESAYLAQRVLSWQITVVGDPLYRPFALPVEEGLRRLEKAGDPDLDWLRVRRINLLANQHQFNVALGVARRDYALSGSLLLAEKTADLYARNEIWNEAIPLYRTIVANAKTDETAMRVGHRLLLLLRLLKQDEEAMKIEAGIRADWPESPYLKHLEAAVP